MTDEIKFIKQVRAEVKHYARVFGTWEDRVKSITKRYRLEQVDGEKHRRSKQRYYPTLWNNVRTTTPVYYARTPEPYCERRWKDNDETGQLASQIAERGTSYLLEATPFDTTMTSCVQDLQLGGRGTSWIRVEPEIVSEKVADGEPKKEKLISLLAKADYIHPCDFGHTNARSWEEVQGVWRKVMLSKDAFKAQFGEEKLKQVKFKYSANDLVDKSKLSDKDKQDEEDLAKACVIEYWDKPTRTVTWFDEDIKHLIKQVPDPLGLEQFFPCPRPLFSTITNESLVPIPDFVYYQDQAEELDSVESRLHALRKGLRLVGVYDDSVGELKRLIKSGYDNLLVPVKDFLTLQQQGGIKNAIEIMPIADVIAAIEQLTLNKDRLLTDIDRIMGIPDVVRGTTNPNETAAAQQMKGDYNSLRAQERQKQVQQFARDNIRLMTEALVEHASTAILWDISGGQFLSTNPQEQELFPQKFEQAVQILKDDKMRSFRIEIETDSTIAMTSGNDKQAKIDFADKMIGWAQINPAFQEAANQAILSAARTLKMGRSVEMAMSNALDAQKAQEEEVKQNPPAPPPPSPDEIKAQLRDKEIMLDDQRKRDQMMVEREIRMYEAEVERMKNEQQAMTEAKRIEQEGQIAIIQAQISQKVEELKIISSTQVQAQQATSAPQQSSSPIHVSVNMPKSGKKRIVATRLPTGELVGETQDVEEEAAI